METPEIGLFQNTVQTSFCLTGISFFFIKEWVDADIVLIRQLVNLNGQFMTYAEFKTKFSNITRTFFFHIYWNY